MFGLRFRLDNDERSSDLRALNVRIRIVEGSTGQVVLDYDGPLDPVRRAPVTFSSWRESADVTVLTAKFEASIPKREPLSVMVEFPPARGWQPRRPVEIVLVGGGWQ